jgi:hypothetical protein
MVIIQLRIRNNEEAIRAHAIDMLAVVHEVEGISYIAWTHSDARKFLYRETGERIEPTDTRMRGAMRHFMGSEYGITIN